MTILPFAVEMLIQMLHRICVITQLLITMLQKEVTNAVMWHLKHPIKRLKSTHN